MNTRQLCWVEHATFIRSLPGLLWTFIREQIPCQLEATLLKGHRWFDRSETKENKVHKSIGMKLEMTTKVNIPEPLLAKTGQWEYFME